MSSLSTIQRKVILSNFANPRTWSIPKDPISIALISTTSTILIGIGGIWFHKILWRRIKNSDSVTLRMLEKKIWVKGVVTSVGDGDNFRLFHTPGPFFSYPFKIRSIPSTPKELKDETIHIRIAGVDAPENAHFGNPSQPHAQESLDWLRSTINDKRMKCQLLRKDQYGRIVAVPYIRRMILPDKPLPLLMLSEGMAVVYTSSGAEYGPWGLKRLQEIESRAKAAKKGLWASKKVELPSTYKKRLRAAEEGKAEVATTDDPPSSGFMSWVRSLFGR
ncbi:hypothetical protein TREMEDRAFT_34464 [Tremella mesenterica DSM 1558]|uniref:uncharacterized protein n=1 Tax=Tremella mesenterica (strain ATCC 24925 / CBS 8224 / DSM 1558 / NBRC 9311 / NRRL Y-6157 / RJB 2259-6 / UBC 559-6) TaxID=578456 RepID=UPI00032C1290|nr:uncharacterized protein TREMEDRAFT_34464 [Tremella mesenterica DSM 1558]EIW66747.1 hypothetical protein TREMEDRAFT_34464 [Tremella mesenterica DSM 1558]